MFITKKKRKRIFIINNILYDIIIITLILDLTRIITIHIISTVKNAIASLVYIVSGLHKKVPLNFTIILFPLNSQI